MAWTNKNIEDDEMRVRLVNSVRGHFGKDVEAVYPRDYLKKDLDDFCWGLWQFFVSSQDAEMLQGPTTSTPIGSILTPYLLNEGGTIVFGPPGAGKTYLALLMAISVDAGIPLFWPVSQTPVLFVNLERSRGSVARRIATINRSLGLDPQRPLLTISARGKSLTDVKDLISRTIEKHRIGLPVVDSISRTGMGDLTTNQVANSIIDTFSHLCTTWLALGHSPRDTDSHIYGGIHFDAGADIEIRLVSQLSEDRMSLGVGLDTIKANDIARPEMQLLAFDFGEHGLVKVRRPRRSEFPELLTKRKMTLADEISDYLLQVPGAKAGASEIAEAIGKNRQAVSETLNRYPRFLLVEKNGRTPLYGLKYEGMV